MLFAQPTGMVLLLQPSAISHIQPATTLDISTFLPLWVNSAWSPSGDITGEDRGCTTDRRSFHYRLFSFVARGSMPSPCTRHF